MAGQVGPDERFVGLPFVELLRVVNNSSPVRRLRAAAVACALALPVWAIAAERPQAANPAADLIIRRGGYLGAVNFVMARPGLTIPIDAPPAGRSRLASLAFLDQYGHHFGITDAPAQLALLKTEADLLGQAHTSYQQYHRGVRVFSGVIKVHQTAKGDILGASGRFYPIKPTLEATPTLDPAAADAAGRKAIPEAANIGLESCELWIVDPAWYGDPAGGGPKLAYKVVYNDIGRNAIDFREAAFIDAHTGELLDRWSLIETLLDRETYDGQGTNAIPGTIIRTEGSSASGIIDVDRAHDYAGDFYNYLQRAFGRDSIDNAGLTIIQTVNTTSVTCPNATWNGVQTRFCAGVAVDDVVAHELAHGLTGYTAGLIYQNQSGQLNESFSDVFGELVDMFNGDVSAVGAPGGTPWPVTGTTGPGVDTPNNARSACSPRPTHPDGVRWLVGEASSAFGGAIRDMFDPTCRNHPDRANSPLQTCSATDSGGVHSGSGVPNHAFMLATDGGTFNGHTVTGIGLIKSGAVWYRALTVYLTPASDFKDAYEALNQSAVDLIGSTPNDPRTGLPSASVFTAFDASQINEALLAVELDTDGRCGQTNNVLDDATIPPECANPVIYFSDNFEGATLQWNVSNSTPPTPYDWVQTGSLPYGRAGQAAYCEDRWVGNCDTQDESGSHSMNSQTITIPANASHPVLAFTHHLGSEGAFDGGRVEIAINSPTYVPVPRTAFEFNPYNSRLRASGTSPLAGQEAWCGQGGRWGRSIVDLSGLGVIGQDIRVRFTFAKDGCTGGPGWFVDDVVVYDCPDCNNNDAADVREYRYRASSSFVTNIGTGQNPTVTLNSVPDASSDVTIEALANADVSAADEYVEVFVNNTLMGRLFGLGFTDCATTPSRNSLVVTAAAWNAAVDLGAGGNTAVIRFSGTAAMNGAACNGSFLGAHVRYNRAGAPADANTNLVPDTCDCPRDDCRADFNCSGGTPTVQDIFDFLAAYFAGSAAADYNGAGGITVQDIFDFLAAYFTGC